MNTKYTAGQHLACFILAMALPNDKGATHAGNWPNSAKFGVDYELFDKQFPQVDHGKSSVYFDDVAELEHWLEENRMWIKGTDYDFSMYYSVYEWDLGPQLKFTKSM